MNKIGACILITVGICVLLASCAKKDERTIDEIDAEKIENFIKNNNIRAQKDVSGVYYQILHAGNGTETPGLNSKITVTYTGRLLDGTVFDSKASDSPLTQYLAYLIKGWQYGVPLIKSGGSIRLIIPSSLGYGRSEQGSIPGNSVLDFDISLVSLQTTAR